MVSSFLYPQPDGVDIWTDAVSLIAKSGYWNYTLSGVQKTKRSGISPAPDAMRIVVNQPVRSPNVAL